MAPCFRLKLVLAFTNMTFWGIVYSHKNLLRENTFSIHLIIEKQLGLEWPAREGMVAFFLSFFTESSLS